MTIGFREHVAETRGERKDTNEVRRREGKGANG